MTKTILLLTCILFLFSCKKGDPKKDLDVINLKDLKDGAQPNSSSSLITSRMIIASTGSGINNIKTVDNQLFVMGSFSSLGSSSSKKIASYYDYALHSFPNNLNFGSVSDIDLFNGRYIIGGYYTTNTSSTYRPLGYKYTSGSTVTTYTNAVGSVNCLYSGSQIYCYVAGTVTSASIYSTSMARVSSSFSVLAYSNPLISSNPYVYATCYFNNSIFMGGSMNSNSEKNIVYSNGTSWIKSGNGFNGNVTYLLPFNGKLYAAGAMTKDGNNSASMNYVNELSAGGTYWSKTGTNNLPAACAALTVHNGQLYACGTMAGVGYIYKYNSTDNVWVNCIDPGFTPGTLLDIESYNYRLYGIERNASGQYSLVSFN